MFSGIIDISCLRNFENISAIRFSGDLIKNSQKRKNLLLNSTVLRGGSMLLQQKLLKTEFMSHSPYTITKLQFFATFFNVKQYVVKYEPDEL